MGALSRGRFDLERPSYLKMEAPRGAALSPRIVSIVIPAYNEAERIVPYLEAIRVYFSKRDESYEVLVVDDGSTDDTASAIRKQMRTDPCLGLISYDANRGKGHAVRLGMCVATGRVRLFADADGSTPIEELGKLRAEVAERGCAVAVGSRARPAPDVKRKIKPHRFVMGQIFRLFRRLVLKVGVIDSQCGFKLFTAEAAERIFSAARVDGFAFDVELLFLAERFGMRVIEVGVHWHDDRASRVNLLTDPVKMLLDMLRIRRLHRGLGA